MARHGDVQHDPQVAAAVALQHRHAAVTKDLDVAGLAAGRQLELDVAVERRHDGLHAQRRVDHGEVEPVDQVVAVAREALVGAHARQHVEVAGSRAGAAGSAAAREPQTLAVVDAGRHLDRDGARRAPPPRAAALLAGLAHYGALPAAEAAGAGAHELAETAQRADLARAAGAATLRAALTARAGLGAAALAGVAGHVGAHLDVARHAEDRLDQVEVDLDLDVVAPRCAGRRAERPAAAAAHRAERVAAEEHVEQVGEAELREVGHALALEAVEPVAVVGRPRLVVGEHLIGFGELP